MKQKNKKLIAAVFIISFSITNLSANTQDRVNKSIYNEGLKKFLLSDFHGAASEFERLYSIDNSNTDNIKMYYKTLVTIGDMEYNNNNFPEARRMYARAISLVGEDENLLWRLKTIDDINDRVRDEKSKNEARLNRILKIIFIAGLSISILFLLIILIVYFRLKRNWSFDDLVFQIQTVMENNNSGIIYYNEMIERLNDSTNRIEMIHKTASDKSQIESRTPLMILHNSDMVLTNPEFDPGGSLLIIAHIIDSKTGRSNHSLRVAETAYRIAELVANAGVHPILIKKIALIHDIGLLSVKGRIFSEEPASLKESIEQPFNSIKKHALRGARIIQTLGLPDIFAQSILHHHERYNGSGYPHGIKGDKIPLISLIIGAAEFLEESIQHNSGLPAITSEKAEVLFGPHAGHALYILILVLERN